MELRTVDLDVVGAKAGAVFAEAVERGMYDWADKWVTYVFALLEPVEEEGR